MCDKLLVADYARLRFFQVTIATITHETRVQRYRTAFHIVCIPFRSVYYTVCGLPRGVEMRFFLEESQPRWSAFRFPDAFSFSRPPPYDKKKPWDTLLKSINNSNADHCRRHQSRCTVREYKRYTRQNYYTAAENSKQNEGTELHCSSKVTVTKEKYLLLGKTSL